MRRWGVFNPNLSQLHNQIRGIVWEPWYPDMLLTLNEHRGLLGNREVEGQE